MRQTRLLRTITALLLLACTTSPHAAGTAHIAAASNLINVLNDISEQYRTESGNRITLSFGSSGDIARQIIQGAPYQLFISADRAYLDTLSENGIEFAAVTPFVQGQIILFIPNESMLSGISDAGGIVKRLYNGEYRRIAIANPEHAPYGVAAREALTHAGLWVFEQKRLLIGENAAQTMQFALNGSVDLAVVPAAYAYLPETTRRGTVVPIPADWYQPVRQYMVLLKNAGPTATGFYHYLLSERVRGIVERQGYTTDVLHN